jgi:hypothetical protein
MASARLKTQRRSDTTRKSLRSPGMHDARFKVDERTLDRASVASSAAHIRVTPN